MNPAPFRIAMAQVNATVGAVTENARRIREGIDQARSVGAHLVSFPELAVTGYPPEDLLFHARFVDANLEALDWIAAATAGICAVAGFVDRGEDGSLYNAAAFMADRQVVDVYRKVLLPNYGVFDEKRYFHPGERVPLYRGDGLNIGVSICEDMWSEHGPPVRQGRGGAHVLVNINASPFHTGKPAERERLLVKRARETGAYVCYNNLVGGQDELVFDGQSMVVAPDGRVIARGHAFEEDLIVADLELAMASRAGETSGLTVVPISLPSPSGPNGSSREDTPARLPEIEQIHRALVLGISDYLGKNGFKDALIGLSGGIDSALVAALAAQALGPEHVTCVYMPSRYSSDTSENDARDLANKLGVRYMELPIEGVFGAYLALLETPFEGRPPNEAEENLQSRVRGNLLMALSNKFGWLVLTTGNKSEMAVGYATLYGDMAGGFAVIKDLPKEMVYAVSRHINDHAGAELIPDSILTKAPTAELREDQLDTDSLPPYEVLDPILEAYVEESRSQREIVDMGFDPAVVARVLRLVDLAEYKRRQAPPGIRITPRAFGRDRRMPITNHYRES